MNQPTFELIHDVGQLAALEPEWWELWRKIPVATVFQAPAWILPWWKVFAPGDFCSIAVYHDGKLAGLAPLWLERCEQHARLLPIGIGLSDYCDVLLDPDCPDAHRILSDACRSVEWDECEFPELMSGACAGDLPSPERCRCETGNASVAPVLEIPAHARGLADVIRRSQRRHIQRDRVVASRRGDFVFSAASAGDAQDLLADLIRLHTARWATCGEDGVFGDRRVAQFHSCALPGLMEAGLLRMHRLTIGAETAALYYGFFDHQRSYAYLQGYDPEYADSSPGSLIIAHAITEAMREGAREFHFLRGDEAYKFAWGATRRCNRIRRFVRGPADDK